MREHVLHVSSPLLVVLLAGCADASARAALDLDAVPALGWQEELRIGSLDDPVAGFSQIGGVRVGPGGLLYVLETQAREVRVYDESGARIRTIGRPGQGPGELERPFVFGLFHDTVWVNDLGNGRISWFDPEGALLFETPTSGRVQVAGGAAARVSLRPGSPQPDGTISQAVGTSIMPGGVAYMDSVLIPVVRFARDGTVLDTVGSTWHRPGAGRIVSLERVAFGVQTGLLESPFRMGDTLSISWGAPEGEEEGAMTILRRGVSGDTLGRLDFSFPAVPLAPYLDSVVASYADRFVDRGYPRHVIEEAVRGELADLPAHHPPISGYHVGADGTLWLRRSPYVNAATQPDVSTWVLVSPDATVRGSLDLPDTMLPSWSDGTTVWLTDRDALDVPWLVRMRIAGTPPALP